MKHTYKLSVPYLGKVIVVSVVSFSCAVSAYQLYQNTNIFSPSLQAASLKNNQVVFPGQDKQSLDQQNKTSEDYSKQKKDAKDQITPKNQSQSSFLFEQNNQLLNNNNPNLPANNPITGTQEKNNTINNNQLPTASNDNTLVINPNGTNDSNSSTTILVPGDTKNTLDSLIPENGQTNSSAGESNDHNSGSSSNSNKNNGSNSNSGKEDNSKPSGDSENKPSKDDNVYTKVDVPDPKPELPKFTTTETKPYPQNPNIDKKYDYKIVSFDSNALETMGVEINSPIYYGKELDDWTLLCNALFIIRRTDEEGNREQFTINNFSENFEIISDYPKVATEDFTVKFRFRPDSKSDWLDDPEGNLTITYRVKDNRVVLLGYDNKEISSLYLKDGMIYDSFGEEQIANLRKYYRFIYGKEEDDYSFDVDQLFLGWSTEPNGKPIGDQSTIDEKGKIVLYPTKLIDIPKEYQVQFQSDYDIDTWGMVYNYTLTGFNFDNEKIDEDISLIDGIDEIKLQQDSYDHYGKLYIPKSVKSINVTDDVYTNYNDIIVDDESPYLSSKNGLVMNKEQTQLIYTVSNSDKKITIPKTIEEIKGISPKIKEVYFENPTNVSSVATLSSIDGLGIFVKEKYYLDCYKKWYDGLSDNLFNEQGKTHTYTIDNGMIIENINDENYLMGVLKSAMGTLIVSPNVKYISDNAFSDNNQISKVVITEDNISLGSHIFEDSSAESIIIFGKNVEIKKDTFEKDNEFKIEVLNKYINDYKSDWEKLNEETVNQIVITTSELAETNGFKYLTIENDSGQWINILLDAPSDLTEYTNNSIPGVIIDEVNSGAFNTCKNLTYVYLDENVSRIGKNAFFGCDKLEGIFSDREDSIYIEENAFEITKNHTYNDALKFIVLNAKYAEFENGYVPYQSTKQLYAPFDGYGYPLSENGYKNCIECSFKYFIDDCNGGHILYGEAIGITMEGEYVPVSDQFYLIKSTKTVKGNITVRDGIRTVFDYAFENCPIDAINISFTDYAYSIGQGAFSNTNLSGEIILPDGLEEIGSGAFVGTQITRFVFPNVYADDAILGSNIFGDVKTLEELVFQSENPISLIKYSYSTPYSFGYDAGDYSISLDGNAKGKEETYINAWTDAFLNELDYNDLMFKYYDEEFAKIDTSLSDDELHEAYVKAYRVAMERADVEYKRVQNEVAKLFNYTLPEEPEPTPGDGENTEQPESPSEELPSNPDEGEDTPSEDAPSNGENPSEDNDSKEDQENQDDNQQSDDQIVEDEGE